MDTTPIFIGEIPALLWGAPSSQLIVAVHGSGSHKGDEVIALLAREAVPKGYRVLSFDLPEHGDRQGHPALCKAQTVSRNWFRSWPTPKPWPPTSGYSGAA